ncbi:hypothetical protein [Pedobacter sp. V48]|uniref:hypothetical protein n=1 Tax=Pedobacter sp. V48 TaxID=509635 RepID=UPI0004AC5B03|nr:hypothetical protein [Pedobacter sp. V48]
MLATNLNKNELAELNYKRLYFLVRLFKTLITQCHFFLAAGLFIAPSYDVVKCSGLGYASLLA